MEEVLKIATVILFCSLFFSKMGMPAAVILFKFNFWKVLIVSCIGGIGGAVAYVFLFSAILKWWDKFQEKRYAGKKKLIFTKSNRKIIKIKNRFGLLGIAILTPALLSIPLGAFLADRFYKNKPKVILYLSFCVVFWSVACYFIYYTFYDSLKGVIF
jgi:hypothetical protein